MCVYDAMAAILNNLHNFENAQSFTSGPPYGFGISTFILKKKTLKSCIMSLKTK